MSDSRWYRDDRDLDSMLALTSAALREAGPASMQFHPGDVVWGLFQNPTKDPDTSIRLFHDPAGTLAGFVWLHPPDAFVLQLRPDAPGCAHLVGRMVRWAEAHLGAAAPEPPATVSVEVPELDRVVQAALAALGYRNSGEAAYQLNHRALDATIPAPGPADGAVVRPVRLDDPAEVAARVELHREVWEPSRFTAEGYARLRERPVYRPDLDLVVVTPAGELAAYGIVWWDPASRTGEFEPVGTAARFRGRGYGGTLIREGLRRLQQLGASDVLVVSATSEAMEPSRRLYASAGFRVAQRYVTWERTLPAGDGALMTHQHQNA